MDYFISPHTSTEGIIEHFYMIISSGINSEAKISI